MLHRVYDDGFQQAPTAATAAAIKEEKNRKSRILYKLYDITLL